jgi:hypothetical protein
VRNVITLFDFHETVLPAALNIESLSACLPFKAKENLDKSGLDSLPESLLR